MRELKRIPELRFGEFGGEWEEKKLGSLFSFKNGINASKEQYEKGYKFINVLDIINNNVITHNDIIGSVDVSKEIFEKNKVEYGNILFQRSSETRVDAGQTGVYLDKNKSSTFGGFIIRGQQKGNEYNPLFMNYMFKTQHSRKEITTKSNGSTRYNVGQETLSNVLVYLPKIQQEQEKIASFLSSVDTKIEQLTSKAKLLQEYKKGVMQKIFSQEIRFRNDDGNYYSEWVEQKLQNLLDMVVDNRGKTPPVSDRGIPLIEINAIGAKTIHYSKVSKFVDDETFNSWFRKYLQDGDILFSTVGQTAICSLYKDDINAVIAQNIVGLRFKNSNNSFMFYLLTEKRNNHQFRRIEMGAVQPSVKVSQMIHIKFSIPCFKEQTKIANFLSSIDSKIEQTQKQLDSIKEFKKALLQQMFV